MTNDVKDLTEYLPRGGWMTTTVPLTFNINDVSRFEKKYFVFENEPDVSYMIRIVLKHGDMVNLTYADEATRDEDYDMLIKTLRRSKFKIVNGKPGPKTNRKD